MNEMNDVFLFFETLSLNKIQKPKTFRYKHFTLSYYNITIINNLDNNVKSNLN